ncbi:MAG: hypothetical protein LBI98_03280 [Endomicrobium sp.]|jgi:hypothetical protein|nr:hypothetical protein [Endomicrobium sp.]
MGKVYVIGIMKKNRETFNRCFEDSLEFKTGKEVKGNFSNIFERANYNLLQGALCLF